MTSSPTPTPEQHPKRVGDWIQTYSGRKVWPLSPQPIDLDIEDIAHALSNICRYTGHVREFYSVAQHSVIASRIVPVEFARWALLHDATEAYLCDVAKPVKPFLGDYKAIERRMMDCVCERFGMPLDEPPSVKEADWILLATEHRDLMPPSPEPWYFPPGIKPLLARIVPVSPAAAKAAFLARFKHLFPEAAHV